MVRILLSVREQFQDSGKVTKQYLEISVITNVLTQHCHGSSLFKDSSISTTSVYIGGLLEAKGCLLFN